MVKLNLNKTNESNRILHIALSLVLVTFASAALVTRANNDYDDEDANFDEGPTGDDQTQLPSLWSAALSGSYHVLYQLEMTGSIQKIEEWASFSTRQFRLDLLSADGTKRTSFLTNGHTDEMFRYQPFRCARSVNGTMFKDLSLVAPLFIGAVWDDKLVSHEVFGLGPLWLRAYKDGLQGQKNGANSLHEMSDTHKQFEIKFQQRADEAGGKWPHKLRFYFAKSSKMEFVDMVDWYLDLDDDDDKEQDGKRNSTTKPNQNYQVRAKVLQVDYNVGEQPFKLPLGYGCSRRLELDTRLQLDIGLVLFHQGSPSQVSFEVTTSSRNEEQPGGSWLWTNNRHSFRVLRVSQPRTDISNPTDSFYVTLTQFRDKTNKMKRIKRVWWAPDNDRGLGLTYTIDQSTGACKVQHENVYNQLVMTFGGNDDCDSECQKSMVLSLDQLAELFGDSGSYHLIDWGQEFGSSAKFRNRFYEKRLDKYELLSPDGTVAWSGPMSIVKQVSTYSQYLEEKSPKLELSSDFDIKLILLLYSDQLDQLLYKVVIELIDNVEVSFSYAHQQMDVSSCFEANRKQEIQIKYPLASVALSRELETRRETLRMLAGESLFWDIGRSINPLQVSNIRATFDPFYMRLQMLVLDLPLTQSFKLQLGFRLMEKANLDFSERKQALLEFAASSGNICGQHCDYYNCFQFSFEPANLSCRIALDPDRVETIDWDKTSEFYTYFERRPPPKANKTPSSNELPVGNLLATWLYQHQHERPHLGLSSVVDLLVELCELAQVTTTTTTTTSEVDALNWLVLRIKMKPEIDLLHAPLADEKEIVLRPSFVEHNLATMNEYSLELVANVDDQQDDGGKGSVEGATRRILVGGGGRELKLQFNVVFNDRSFKQYTGETLRELTYEQCEQHCELNDCRSFVYCKMEEICQISGQHEKKFLHSMSGVTLSQRQCNIYALDYLSKFEPFGRVAPPGNLQKLTHAIDGSTVTDESECATACMDHREFACQSFYLCRRPVSKCYLMAEVANLDQATSDQLASDQLADQMETTPLNVGNKQQVGQCNYFVRSYLSQFDKYIGKRLNMDQVEVKLLISAGSIQDCAKFCLKSKCLAFDACAAERGSNSIVFTSLKCYLLTDSVQRNQLVPNKRCTTFVVSDKSHFNVNKLQLAYNQDNAQGNQLARPDEEANIGVGSDERVAAIEQFKDETLQQDLAGDKLQKLDQYGRDKDQFGERTHSKSRDASADGGSGWLAKLFSISTGLVLGFGLIIGWNVAYARNWLSPSRRQQQQQQQQTSTFRLRPLGSGWMRMF